MAVGDAGENRDHLVVAFERVNIDDAAAARQRRQACAADKILDPGLGEHIGQLLLGHAHRFDAEEPVEQPPDFGIIGCDMITIARQGLQLALLALEPAAERVADQGCRCHVRRNRQQRAIVGRGLLRQQRKRIRRIPPAQRLLAERQHVGLGPTADGRNQCVEIGSGCSRGEIPVPQRHVEGGVLAAHEPGGANAAAVPQCKRQQQQRPMLGVVGDNDERPKTLARTDLPLPGFKEIEALIRRKELPVVFESAPDLLGASEIVENIDAGDATRARPCRRSGRSVFDRGGHGHRKTCP